MTDKLCPNCHSPTYFAGEGWECEECGEIVREERQTPKIVCLCGSTKFADLHAIKRWEFEKDGKAICLMINYLPEWYARKQGWNEPAHLGEQAGNKEVLDVLHLRKIDLADEVFVINKDHYIGESTRREIEYAKAEGKPVHYLVTEKD